MNKKAQGISINIVIVAAVALLVLVILSVIFMGRMGTFSATSKDCVAQGGKCFVKTDGCGSGTTPGDNAFTTEYSTWTCSDTAQVCCIKAG